MAAVYPSVEKRLPREHFTRVLEKLCKRLDGKSSAVLPYKWRHSPFCEGEEFVRIEAVWVVGSYARGSLDCGDLDLVVQREGSHAVSSATVRSSLLGRIPRMRAYMGTPQQNQSGVEFEEAVKIWAQGFDWQAVLCSMPTDPTASRFHRASDGIPLRLEQLPFDVDVAAGLLAARAAGSLSWRFIPMDQLAPVAPQPTLARQLEFAGRAKQQLGPYLQAYLDSDGVLDFELGRLADSRWHCSGTVVGLGGDALPSVRQLDDPAVERVAVMPYLNIRGPNGIWVIERGPNHLLVERFTALSAWVVFENGALGTCLWYGTRHDVALAVSLYSSHVRASTAIQEFVDGGGERDGLAPKLLQGKELLRVLAGVELLELDETIMPLTYKAAWIAEVDDYVEGEALLVALEKFCAQVDLRGATPTARYTDKPVASQLSSDNQESFSQVA